VARLEQKLRELKSINRSLSKKLRRINKGYRKLRSEPEEESEERSKPQPNLCPDCKEPVRPVEVAGRKWESCRDCGWRSQVKID